MNHCILLVEVVQAPQVRYTSDQIPVAELIVQFNTPRDTDPPATLKLVAWNRLATEVEQQGYRVGDRLLVEGRISMVTIDRQEGFRENGLNSAPSVFIPSLRSVLVLRLRPMSPQWLPWLQLPITHRRFPAPSPPTWRNFPPQCKP
ncbi:MAG: single-stranded DNA-binding protein, partial [Coleofasciculaceae cyanobacterium RL_1_1]|nr:single-stranded DNA-binding protein [Coleofasciculaceae cyanobacterium RL_1_1]